MGERWRSLDFKQRLTAIAGVVTLIAAVIIFVCLMLMLATGGAFVRLVSHS